MDPVGAHCGCGRWYAALTAAGTGLFWLFVHAITGIEWLLIPFTASFAAQLTLFGVSRIGLQPDRGPRSLLVLGYTGLGWALTYVPGPPHRLRRRRAGCHGTGCPGSPGRPRARPVSPGSGGRGVLPTYASTLRTAGSDRRDQPHLCRAGVAGVACRGAAVADILAAAGWSAPRRSPCATPVLQRGEGSYDRGRVRGESPESTLGTNGICQGRRRVSRPTSTSRPRATPRPLAVRGVPPEPTKRSGMK